VRNAAARLQWFLVAVLLSLPGVMAAQQPLEHEVKAAFLYKFPAFIEWPAKPAPDLPFVIAVVGASDVAAELREIARGHGRDGNRIDVREIAEDQAVTGAHVVFVGRSAAVRLPLIAKATANLPVLIVGEMPNALDLGCVINFVVSEERVRFDVAFDQAEARGLRINARLLAAARRVRGGP
jgi:hypothetical protein